MVNFRLKPPNASSRPCFCPSLPISFLWIHSLLHLLPHLFQLLIVLFCYQLILCSLYRTLHLTFSHQKLNLSLMFFHILQLFLQTLILCKHDPKVEFSSQNYVLKPPFTILSLSLQPITLLPSIFNLVQPWMLNFKHFEATELDLGPSFY